MSIAAWGEWHRNVWHSHAATLINASSRLTVTLGGYTCLHCWSMMFAKDVSRSNIIQLGSNIIMTNCEKLWKKQDLYTCKNPEPIQLVMYGDLRYRMVLNLYTPNLVSTYSPLCPALNLYSHFSNPASEPMQAKQRPWQSAPLISAADKDAMWLWTSCWQAGQAKDQHRILPRKALNRKLPVL